MTLSPPDAAIEDALNAVVYNMRQIEGANTSTESVVAYMAIAQVMATCALVHAVRELTAAVQTLVGSPDA